MNTAGSVARACTDLECESISLYEARWYWMVCNSCMETHRIRIFRANTDCFRSVSHSTIHQTLQGDCDGKISEQLAQVPGRHARRNASIPGGNPSSSKFVLAE